MSKALITMQINLIAVGDKMPTWINQGYEEYAKRLSTNCQLQLTTIPMLKRNKKSDLKRLKQQESQMILATIPKNNHVVALDIDGQCWDTTQLARQLAGWLHGGQNVSLLIGGPEGLTADCLTHAKQRWSLSPLTFPHPLVRVIVAEQIYRAYSLLHHHPYHK